MIFEESYTLHNGVAIPKLALGTWFIDDDKAAEAVQAAVNIGYSSIRQKRLFCRGRASKSKRLTPNLSFVCI